MTIQTVPTFGDLPGWVQRTTLEGQSFALSFAHNQREDCWYLSLADASGVDIYNGRKLVCLQLLFRKCVDMRRPAGDFVVLDTTGANTPPGANDLVAGSGRCRLLYLTRDVIAQLSTPAGVASFAAALATNTQTSPASTYGAR